MPPAVFHSARHSDVSGRGLYMNCNEEKVPVKKKGQGTNHGLIEQYPDLVAQWHPSLNGTLRPRKVPADSKKRVWWNCPKGHVWRATVYSRTRATDPTACPVCRGIIKDIGGLLL